MRFPWITQTIKEYESRTSNEAKFVWAVDKLIILLMRCRYYVEHGITKEVWAEGIAAHRKKAHAHPTIGSYYDQLLAFLKHTRNTSLKKSLRANASVISDDV